MKRFLILALLSGVLALQGCQVERYRIHVLSNGKGKFYTPYRGNSLSGWEKGSTYRNIYGAQIQIGNWKEEKIKSYSKIIKIK